jgi:hypothetical protein
MEDYSIENRQVALTYEVEPNLIYNFYFTAGCSYQNVSLNTNAFKDTKVKIVSGYDFSQVNITSGIKGLVDQDWSKGVYLASD